MKKYLTRWNKIEIVEVDRETESSVWIRGRRNAKITDYESYHDTEEAARAFVVAKAGRDLNNALSRVKYAEKALAEAKAIKVITP